MPDFAFAQKKASKLPKIGDMQRVVSLKSALMRGNIPNKPGYGCFFCDSEKEYPSLEWKYDKTSEMVFLCNEAMLRFGFNASHLSSSSTQLPYRYNFIVSKEEDGGNTFGEALTVLKITSKETHDVCNGLTLSPSNENASFIGTTSEQDLHLGTLDGTNKTITIRKSGGLVGINELDPQFELHVNGRTKVNQTLEVDGQISGNQNAFINGVLSINEANPNATLHVGGTGYVSSDLFVNQGISAGTGSIVGNLNVGQDIQAKKINIFSEGSVNDGNLNIGRENKFWHVTQRSSENFDLQFFRITAQSIYGAPLLTLKDDNQVNIGIPAAPNAATLRVYGKLGIGTDNPIKELHVKGSIALEDISTSNFARLNIGMM